MEREPGEPHAQFLGQGEGSDIICQTDRGAKRQSFALNHSWPEFGIMIQTQELV